MQWDELPALFPGCEHPGRWLPLLRRHQALLAEAEPHTRVTSVAPDSAIQRHYAESLEIWRIGVEALGATPAKVVDVGSGGGFPGLVMACVAAETRFALVEPLQKRARLLGSIAAELGLENVTVHALRAEEAARGPLRTSANLVTARAVAPLRELLEYTAPFCAAEGRLVLPKGSALGEEVGAAGHALLELALEATGVVAMRREVSEALGVAIFRRTGEMPAKYPRRPGMAGKRPL